MIDFKVLASGSKGNCYIVDDGETRLMVECGLRFKEIQRALDFKLSSVAGCLISHSHQDHCRAVIDLLKTGIDVYVSNPTMLALNLFGHRIHPLSRTADFIKYQSFQLGSWAILPFETEHDCEGSLGFLLANKAGEKLLYATDTCYLKYRFKGLTHIMVECNHSTDALKENVAAGVVPRAVRTRIIQSHFSLKNVKEFLRVTDLSKLQEIHLLHLSDNNADSERFKREIQELVGKEIYIA